MCGIYSRYGITVRSFLRGHEPEEAGVHLWRNPYTKEIYRNIPSTKYINGQTYRMIQYAVSLAYNMYRTERYYEKYMWNMVYDIFFLRKIFI